eukprot:2117678-Ditylum_brightwellii.AAC.1
MEQSYPEGKVRKNGKYRVIRKNLEEDYTADRCHSVKRAEKALNQWLLVVPHTANNMVLSKEEVCDQVLMCYVITPKDLPKCNVVALIGGQHNEVQDDLGVVGTQVISPHAVCNVPRVQSGQDGKRKSDDPVDYQ